MNAAIDSWRPLQSHERIQTLDVIRGFALLGIFLMNVEWFNRPIAELGSGVPAGLAGLDLAAAWLIHTFVSSKFWPMFSLLFGMGFAVMLQRARAKGSAFVATYARRTAALAAFGLLHGVLLWPGDILFAYAITAAALLLTLFGKPRHWLMLLVPFGVLTALLVVVAWLARRFREPVDRRPLRAGLAIFLLPTFMMLAGGLFMMFGPQSPGASAGTDRTANTTIAAASRQSPAASPRRTPDAEDKAKEKERQEQAKRRAERKAEAAEETRVMSGGTYAEAVRLRAKSYLGDLGNSAGLAIIALGLFLLGGWFIQSGMIVQPQRHLPAFRKLALTGVLAGGALSIGSSLIALRPLERAVGAPPDATWQLASALHMMGGLPLMLGYVACLVLALQTSVGQRLLGWLAPAGRMRSVTILCIGTLT